MICSFRNPYPSTYPAQQALKLYEVSQLAAYRSVISIDDYRDQLEFPEIIMKALDMIISGTDPAEVKSFINASSADGEGDLPADLYSEAVLNIQSGMPVMVFLQHCFYLLKKEEENWIRTELYLFELYKQEFYRNITRYAADSALYERVNSILSIQFVYRQNVLTGGLGWKILANALPACNPDIQIRIIDNMPIIDVRNMLFHYKHSFPSRDEIHSALKSVVREYNLIQKIEKSILSDEDGFSESISVWN